MATICCARMSSGVGDDLDRVELAGAHRAHGRRALDELVAREREQDSFGYRPEEVAGAADALEQLRDRPRRAEVADEVDVADVDAELERRGRDHHRAHRRT